MLTEDRAAYILEKMAGISLRAAMAGKTGSAAEGMTEKEFKRFFTKGKGLSSPADYAPGGSAWGRGSAGRAEARAAAAEKAGATFKKGRYGKTPSGVDSSMLGRLSQLLGGGSKLRSAMGPGEARKVLGARLGVGAAGAGAIGGLGYAAHRALRSPASNLRRNAGIAALLAGGGLGGYALSKQSSYAELEAWLQPGTCAK